MKYVIKKPLRERQGVRLQIWDTIRSTRDKELSEFGCFRFRAITCNLITCFCLAVLTKARKFTSSPFKSDSANQCILAWWWCSLFFLLFLKYIHRYSLFWMYLSFLWITFVFHLLGVTLRSSLCSSCWASQSRLLLNIFRTCDNDKLELD